MLRAVPTRDLIQLEGLTSPPPRLHLWREKVGIGKNDLHGRQGISTLCSRFIFRDSDGTLAIFPAQLGRCFGKAVSLPCAWFASEVPTAAAQQVKRSSKAGDATDKRRFMPLCLLFDAAEQRLSVCELKTAHWNPVKIALTRWGEMDKMDDS